MRTMRRDSRRMTSISRGSRPELGGERSWPSRRRHLGEAHSRPSALETIFWLSTSTSPAAQRRALPAAASHHDAGRRRRPAGTSPMPSIADDLVARRHGQRGARAAAEHAPSRPRAARSRCGARREQRGADPRGRRRRGPSPGRRTMRARAAQRARRHQVIRRTTARRTAAASRRAVPAATPLVPSPERDGVERRRPAAPAARRAARGSPSRGDARHVAGNRQERARRRCASPRPGRRRPRRCGRGCRLSASAPAPKRRASAADLRLARHHPDPVEARRPRAPGARPRASRGPARAARPASSTRIRRCLALTRSLTGTAATIMRPGPGPYAGSLPPSRGFQHPAGQRHLARADRSSCTSVTTARTPARSERGDGAGLAGVDQQRRSHGA